MTKDEELRAAIMGEQDPRRLVELVTEYYGDPGRADGASRSLLFLHLGLLSGTIMKLLDDAMRTEIDGLLRPAQSKRKQKA